MDPEKSKNKEDFHELRHIKNQVRHPEHSWHRELLGREDGAEARDGREARSEGGGEEEVRPAPAMHSIWTKWKAGATHV